MSLCEHEDTVLKIPSVLLQMAISTCLKVNRTVVELLDLESTTAFLCLLHLVISIPTKDEH